MDILYNTASLSKEYHLEDIMDSRQVARFLGVSISAVNRLCARGSLASRMQGSRRLFSRKVVEAYGRDVVAQKRRPPAVRLTIGEASILVVEAVKDAQWRKFDIEDGEK